ncbi:MAG: membrane dipeptidase [Phycisphaerales bacterium]|nr:membrane dipeptidase [Phycisphaerales bacterium]
MIVDAHLDLAYNAGRGRRILLPANQQIPDEQGIPTVGLPDLRRGQVDLICATIFCQPDLGPDHGHGYRTAAEAAQMARDQLQWYQQQFRDGQMRQIFWNNDLQSFQQSTTASAASVTPAAILLMEGADPIVEIDDLIGWFEAGLRIIGLAWKGTRYAGGTGQPGPLTPAGVQFVRAMDKLGLIHDTSHLAEQSFWQLLEITGQPVIATHSNCRSIIDTDRQLSDKMIRAIANRQGVIGINFYSRFLIPPDELDQRPATLVDVVQHIHHIADLTGSTDNIGIGTDMDGGFGRQHVPMEIQTSSDLHRLVDALNSAGFSDQAISDILAKNWLRFFGDHLPSQDKN